MLRCISRSETLSQLEEDNLSENERLNRRTILPQPPLVSPNTIPPAPPLPSSLQQTQIPPEPTRQPQPFPKNLLGIFPAIKKTFKRDTPAERCTKKNKKDGSRNPGANMARISEDGSFDFLDALPKNPILLGKPQFDRPKRPKVHKSSRRPIVIEEPPAAKDCFVGSDLVMGLSKASFREYVDSKDVALVFFYDPLKQDSYYSAKQLRQAAQVTTRDNHAYAAINCLEERQLCDEQGESRLPFYTLYTKGQLVGTIRDVLSFPHETMKSFVEKCPLATDTRNHLRPGGYVAKPNDTEA